MLDAHDRELQRTQKLVEIGAASRQELEKIHAEHAAQTAAVQSARSQLELLGVSAPNLEKMAPGHSVSATTSVPAPIDGVVTERGANVGLNVDSATKLFTVVDLSDEHAARHRRRSIGHGVIPRCRDRALAGRCPPVLAGRYSQ